MSGSRTLDIAAKTRHRRLQVETDHAGCHKTRTVARYIQAANPARASLLGLPNRKRDRAGKQKALLQAALRLFATKGYEVTTTREIAAAAGCAEGLIHRYFKGKAGLLTALVEYHDHRRAGGNAPSSAIRRGSRGRVPSVGGLGNRISCGRTGIFSAYLFRGRYWIRRSDGVISRAVLSSRTKAVMECLKRHQQCAHLPQEELEVLAQSVGMFGLVFGFMRPVVLGQERTQARKMAATLACMVVRGLHPSGTD